MLLGCLVVFVLVVSTLLVCCGFVLLCWLLFGLVIVFNCWLDCCLQFVRFGILLFCFCLFYLGFLWFRVVWLACLLWLLVVLTWCLLSLSVAFDWDLFVFLFVNGLNGLVVWCCLHAWFLLFGVGCLVCLIVVILVFVYLVANCWFWLVCYVCLCLLLCLVGLLVLVVVFVGLWVCWFAALALGSGFDYCFVDVLIFDLFCWAISLLWVVCAIWFGFG